MYLAIIAVCTLTGLILLPALLTTFYGSNGPSESNLVETPENIEMEKKDSDNGLVDILLEEDSKGDSVINA